MDKEEVLNSINTMPLKYWDDDSIDGETIIYIATVEDSEINRDIIKSLGYKEQEIDGFKSYRDGEIDITNFVWNYANWFDGKKFIIVEFEN